MSPGGMTWMWYRPGGGTVEPTGGWGGSLPLGLNATTAGELADEAITLAWNMKTAWDNKVTDMGGASATFKVPYRADLVAQAINLTTASSHQVLANGTDQTANLQWHCSTTNHPAGTILYLPAGTYKINGNVNFTAGMTLVGAEGTVIDATYTGRANNLPVFSANIGGSGTVTGLYFYGLDIRGRGAKNDTNDTTGMMCCFQQKYGTMVNPHFEWCRFRDVPHAGLTVLNTTGLLVENCIFSNNFMPGYGYGVAVNDDCSGSVIRNCAFITHHRHCITEGSYGANLLTQDITIDTCYFNQCDHFGGAVDTHSYSHGTNTVKNCLFYRCQHATHSRSGGWDCYDNVVIGDGTVPYDSGSTHAFTNCIGFYIHDSAITPPADSQPLTNRIHHNLVIGDAAAGCEMCGCKTDVTDNVFVSDGSYGIYGDTSNYNGGHLVANYNILRGCNSYVSCVGGGSWTDTNNFKL